MFSGRRKPASPAHPSMQDLHPKDRDRHLKRIKRRKVYSAADYERLLAPYQGYESLRLMDYVRESDVGDRKILLIRHDVDHDPYTALRIAQWEHDRGLRATYCLLHSAWYYGDLQDHGILHTSDLVQTALELCKLGHEVNFHNNLVVAALTQGVDPVKLLAAELEFFRSIGVAVVGTSTHGDALCRELNFRNWELFKECCDNRFGGPRTVVWRAGFRKNSIELGQVSMFDFGLEYEAYDIARDVYHTDSGGTQRTRFKTFGRRSFGRHDPNRGEVVGVLTHPIWWDFGAF